MLICPIVVLKGDDVESKEARIKKMGLVLCELNERYENYIYIGIHSDEFFQCADAVEGRLDELGG